MPLIAAIRSERLFFLIANQKIENPLISATATEPSVMPAIAPSESPFFADYLFEGNDCRMNTPGEKTGNWLYRLPANYKKSLKKIKSLNKNRTAKVRNQK